MQHQLTLSLIAAMVHGLVGNEYLYFDYPIRINGYNIWAVSTSPKGDVYVMDSYEDWCQLDANELRHHEIISLLYPKVEAIVNRQKAIA